ncbi:MAG: DNA recombination protein RmuC [Bacteroidaceae bacterium]|nr:DNA recombination protein RmuC [Bacteroidaceae bacterium]
MEVGLIIALVIVVVVAVLMVGYTRRDGERRCADLKTETEGRIAAMRDEAEGRLAAMKEEKDSRIAELTSAHAQAVDEKVALQQDKTALTVKLQGVQQLLQLTQQQAKKDDEERQERFATELKLAREQMRSQFEKELEVRSEAFKKQNTEQMAQVVGPLQKELESLRTLVNDSKAEQTKNTSALEASIKAVFEHDKERDKTTQSLADALKNRGKVQGDWGEQVLENILADSGLREGIEYKKQVNVKAEDGNNERPDVVVYAADGTNIIIDSKVSLTAYTDYVGAEDDEERKAALKANYDSIWTHVCELSDKQYFKKVDKAMPIVLMFVPNEGSYILAMNKDPQLGTKAYKKGVLIINPTNLMVVLRLMFLTWQNTRQEKNNRDILQAASKIYEKYSTFAEGYVALGNQLRTVNNSYEEGVKRLTEGRGNLSKQLQDLLKYGVTTTKRIPDELKSIDTSEERENEQPSLFDNSDE